MICLVECRNENIQILNIEIDGSNNNYDEIEKEKEKNPIVIA